MIKEWYIEIEGHSEGPFSIEDLKKEYRITPDTLVWKEGFSEWVPIRSVKELKVVFEDPKPKKNTPTQCQEQNGKKLGTQDVLVARYEFPPNLIIWLLLIIALLLFLYFSRV